MLEYYKGKRVFLTGHTGFKGTWMTRILLNAGAIVTGYSLEPPQPSLYSIAGFDEYIKNGQLTSVIADIRDLDSLKKSFEEADPQVVFHLAAQPIVRDSYKDPVYTYETNVMGTVNVMEAVRCHSRGVESVLIITTDKVYKNEERPIWGYREYEPLDGFDPYSNSKSCAELVVHSYRDSFFRNADGGYSIPISTARAGNVIGGGDFANDRIIPDCVRALEAAIADGVKEAVVGVRNPYSTRPYQHVLEPLAMYLTLGAAQAEKGELADWYNVGPDDADCVTTGDLVTIFCDKWNALCTDPSLPKARWENRAEKGAPHEAGFLKLDSTKIKQRLGYSPVWHIAECMEKTAEFTKVYLTDVSAVPSEMDRQIGVFFGK